MRKIILVVAFLAFAPLVTAQLSLRNSDVIRMVKAGLGEDLIITTINAAPGYYDTSPGGLAALKRAGVSDKVFAAIVQKAFHICFAGTDREQAQDLRLDLMEHWLQAAGCGPKHSRPMPGTQTAPVKKSKPLSP